MLQPPGSSRTAGKAHGGGRKKVVESTTDQLRKLSKVPANKKCADCGSKLPQCVNLTSLTFVCMACAGIHREINNKVKSLGHSTFTNEEVEQMSGTDNDQVNALWLARYDAQRDRMKPPQGDSDQNYLRTWIRRKYQDKAWYGGTGGGGSAGDTSGGHHGRGSATEPSHKRQQPRRGGNLQPTVVEIPPEKPPVEEDLFATFDAPAPQVQDDWAGFGGSSQSKAVNGNKNDDDFANFAGSSGGTGGSNSVVDPFAVPQTQQQPPSVPPPQQNFADFGGAGGDPFAQTAAPTAPPPQQNFANSGSSVADPFAQTVAAPIPPPQQNFGNFGGPNPSHIQQQQHQPQDPFAQQVPPPSQQGGFANFGQQQQMHQHQPPLPEMSNTSGGGFAHFDQLAAPSTPAQPAFVQQQQQGGGDGGFADFGKPHQTTQQGFASFDQPPHPPPSMSPPPPEPHHIMSGGGNKDTVEDPMDAFNHLSINGNNSNNATMGMAAYHQPHVPKYVTKQIVCYKIDGGRTKAQVVKVHLDGGAEPTYSVMLPFGTEKKTDDGHLEPLDPAFLRIESKLLSLSSAQLQQVEAYLSTMPPDASAVAPHPVTAVTPNLFGAQSNDVPGGYQIPATVDPSSPSGMSHVSQLTQPPGTVPGPLLVPALSSNVGVGGPPTVGMGSSMGGPINGGASSALDTIPSPHPVEKAPVPGMMAGQMSTPSVMDNSGKSGLQMNLHQQDNQPSTGMPQAAPSSVNHAMGMMPPQSQSMGGGIQQQMKMMQPANYGMGMQQTHGMGMGMAATNNSMPHSEGFIPSPPAKAPSSGQEQLSMLGQISSPPFSQEQQQTPQVQQHMQQMNSNGQMLPHEMQGQQMNNQMQAHKMYGQQQLNGHNAVPSSHMMQGQMNYQMGVPQMMNHGQMGMPPQMQGQMMNSQQMMMPAQMMGGQVQQQQQQQQPMVHNQAPLSPQGNPFDMY